MPAIFLSSNLVALSLILALLLAVSLWFLELIKRREIFFPAVAILKKEKKKPKISVEKPPLVPFICSILTLLFLLLYSFKPHFFSPKPSPRSVEPLHIFVDLSPSLSASYSLKDYKDKIYFFYKKEKKNYRISLSSSLSEKIYSEKEISYFLDSLEFHKKKTFMSEKMGHLVSKLPDTEIFVIFSDQEKTSWKDFFWKSLSKEKRIVFIPNPKSKKESTNIFISSVSYMGKKRGLYNWEIKLSRSHTSLPSKGSLWLRIKGQSFFKKEWSFSLEEESIYLSYSLDENKIQRIQNKELLSWNIETDEKDLIDLDNTHSAFFTRNTKLVSLIADPEGESLLEDPASHLEIMLRLFDFQIKRYDKLQDFKKAKINSSFSISFIKEEPFSLTSYCPTEGQQKKIWLAPATIYQNYNSLCSCLNTLMEKERVSCPQFLSKEDFSKILREKSFEQIGGSLGELESVLAWSLQEKEKDITLFLIPLFPSKKEGLSHSQFPIFLSLLLEEKEKTHEQLAFILENVDPKESALLEIKKEKLPPTWKKESLSKHSQNFSQEKKSFPLVLGLLFLMLLAVLVESIFHLKQRKLVSLLPFLFLFPFTEKAYSKIELSYYKADRNLINQEELSYRLEEVTSIQMDSKIKNFSDITPSLFEEPWIWVNSKSFTDFLKKKGHLESLSAWVRQGGILLLEGESSKEALKQIEGTLLSRKINSWQSISLDHELLRSFFLLKSLPSCQKRSWSMLEYEGRVAVLQIPFSLLSSFSSKDKAQDSCFIEKEKLFQLFVNITMVALTLDYKKDQIHLDEILKRLN